MRYTVLIVGGYGVFGGRLARLLGMLPEVRVLVAGRSLAAAQRFCRRHGGEPLRFDRNGDLTAQLAASKPDAVVDAAGPFQLYGRDPYRLARAALAAGAHYLDLADDAAFVEGIRSLDAEAKQAGCTALSGVSSVPAISSAVIERFRRGLNRIEHIETVILPGNRAPRGLSVVRAIAAQAGRPLRLWRGGVWQTVPGWSGLTAYQLSAAGRSLEVRDASFIGAPDLALFPARYGARTVLFRAGLELGVLHLGLSLLAWLPRLRLLPSLAPVARVLRALATLLEPFGEDRGGMEVTVIGENSSARNERRQWTLIVEAGDGPFIPALAAFCWLHHRLRGSAPKPGARACIGELSLEQLAVGFAYLKIVSEQAFTPEPTLFETALGADWPRLAAPLRELHGAFRCAEYAGEASVENGRNFLARFARWMMRLPAAAERVPVRVSLKGTAMQEHWLRRFGHSRFESTLRWDAKRQRITETFGLMRFELGLHVEDGSLHWPVTRGWLCGVPLPRFLLLISDSREDVDEKGRFRFDVSIRLRGIGLVARYRGWLVAGKP
ncbi:MAG: DUF4166 domain-containing protein [Pseudomonadota bacterium]